METRFTVLAFLAMAFATSCSNEETMDINTDPIGKAIDFRPSVGTATRATVTTFSNLGDFNVFARGVHSSTGAMYETFLIGTTETESSNPVYKPGIAKRVSLGENSGTWKLTHNVYWPEGVSAAVFWAFSDRNNRNNNNEGEAANGTCITDGTIGFDANGPKITSYTPKKKGELTDQNAYFDGALQRDLVSAFTYDKTKDPHVELAFSHQLSQVQINLQKKYSSTELDNRVVKIKGAWLVNVSSSGDLSAGFTYTPSGDNNAPGEAEDNVSWTAGSNLVSYGAYYGNKTDVLSIDPAKDVPASNSTDSKMLNIGYSNITDNNLMLIPQNKTAWDGTTETTDDSYILLLCRVELKHAGDAHPSNDEAVSAEKGGYHYHQQFPITTTYDENAYGLTAVAVPINWERGKKYSYNLDICGENSGAGVYPPNVPTDDPDKLKTYLQKFIAGNFKIDGTGNGITNVITQIPTGKKVGDRVLTESIQFSVTVKGWEDGETWVNGSDENTSD